VLGKILRIQTIHANSPTSNI
jgi:hypothetical protein